MLIISNHIHDRLKFPDHAIIRVNMAWIPNRDALHKVLTDIKDNLIFLDCPYGRKKPPQPTLSINDAIDFTNLYTNIRYLAISNTEDVVTVRKIYTSLTKEVVLVPKIETELGVKNIIALAIASNTEVVMLDKEDLYINVNHDNSKYLSLIQETRTACRSADIKLVELEGVVFSQFKEAHEDITYDGGVPTKREKQ